MAKILIIIPGLPKKNLLSGWSGMLKNFLDEMRSHEIKIFCTSINLFQKSSSIEYFSSGKKSFYIFKRNLNIFDLLKRFTYILRFNLPIQAAFFSPKYSNDLVFRNLYKDCDYAISFTSRVIAFQDELLNADIKKKIFKHFYMVDSLYLAFKDRAKEQKNIFKYLLYKRESLKLRYLEKKYLNKFDKITLFNIEDVHKVLNFKKNNKLHMHPLKPYLKLNEYQNITFEIKDLKFIYLLGNFKYGPNLVSLKEFINFLEINNLPLKEFLYQKNLKFNILGFMNPLDRTLLNNSLKNKKLNDCVQISNPISNYEDLKKDGLTTISYVKTNYGRQTKDFDSLNLMLPILKYQKKGKNISLSNIYNGSSFYKTFSSHKELITHLKTLLNKKKLLIIKKDILKQMIQEIKLNNKFYENLLDN